MNISIVKRQVVLILAAFFVLVAGLPAAAEDCRETVVIDSVEYDIPPRWCGHKLDSADIALPEDLVRLPEHLCFEDYRIYVLPSTRDALVKMAGAARADGVDLIVDSGFRSANFQKRIIRRRLAEGKSFAAIVRFVAPPGYSEHETGRALDFVPSEAAFAKTDAYRWLKKHADEYGFVETYPEEDNETAPWESSHWCYHPER